MLHYPQEDGSLSENTAEDSLSSNSTPCSRKLITTVEAVYGGHHLDPFRTAVIVHWSDPQTHEKRLLSTLSLGRHRYFTHGKSTFAQVRADQLRWLQERW